MPNAINEEQFHAFYPDVSIHQGNHTNFNFLRVTHTNNWKEISDLLWG